MRGGATDQATIEQAYAKERPVDSPPSNLVGQRSSLVLLIHLSYNMTHHHQATFEQTCNIPKGRQAVTVTRLYVPTKGLRRIPTDLRGRSTSVVGGPQPQSLHSDSYIGKDGIVRHTECMPTHADRWRRAHDDMQSCVTLNRIMRLARGTHHTLLQIH